VRAVRLICLWHHGGWDIASDITGDITDVKASTNLFRSNRSPLMYHFVVTATLKPGCLEEVRKLLREGPPFEIAQTSLQRHLVFLAGDELVFLFEGEHAEHEVKDLLADPHVLGRIGRLGSCIEGAPRLPEEVFSWERSPMTDGLAFGPQPGPGDSEGALE
jgi:hypothetical protein